MMFLHKRPTNIFLFTVGMMILLGSCTVVKHYPKEKPFVYKNSIEVQGTLSRDETKRLETELINYWDDSLNVNTISQFGIRTVIRNPKVFDSSKFNPSIALMRSYLNAQGYYNNSLSDTFYIDTVQSQLRTTVKMTIDIGKNLRIDTVVYSMNDTALDRLAEESIKQSPLKKGKPYSKQLIATELDRLVTLYRRNGFFKLTRENLVAELDTSDVALLDINLDPFEQAQIISEATEKRRRNPTAVVKIMQRDSSDTADAAYLTRYRIGNIYYYPEARINDVPDSLINLNYRVNYTELDRTIKQNEVLIHFRPLQQHTYLRKGTVYNEERYFKTVNAFSQLGAWNRVDVRTRERQDTVPMIDFHFFLTPAQKYSIGTDLEVSRNSGTILNGNLLGIANNITFRNRNAWKESIQTSTVIRNGIELSFSDSNLLRTFQSSVSHTISIPKFIVPFRLRRTKQLDDYKTIISLSGAYTDRRDFFRLRSLISSFGYEWKNKNKVWLYRPLNVELYSLDTLRGLTNAFVANPFLRTAFNTGYIISQTFTFNVSYNGRQPNVKNYVRFGIEEAGALFARIPSLRDRIYQYVKLEGDFRQLRHFRKSGFAYRFFAGAGYNYGNDPVLGQSLPFYKQFVAGGPNSMRAWSLRQLGLGSSLLSDTSTSFRDRYGDAQLEANFEYRFPLATISTVKIGSALFADIGNIWNLKRNTLNPMSTLNLSKLDRDIAIGVGTGIRMDFNYFLVRVDFGYKVKDPARRNNDGWMSIKNFEWRNNEFKLNGSGNGRLLERNNYAVQLGIGLPF